MSTRIIIYYLLSIIIMVFYGGEVCPFIDTLTLWRWGQVLAVFFGLMFAVRFWIIKYKVDQADLYLRPRKQLIWELLIFIAAGVAIAVYNHFTFTFPPLGSGGKVLVGTLTLGSFLSIDMALERERNILLKSRPEDIRLTHSHKFYSVTRKFSLMAILVFTFITAVMLLVLGKDLYWIAMIGEQEMARARRAVTIEIIFVIGITTVLVLNLIYSYSRNLKLFFGNETRVLDEVNKGNLNGFVPVLSNDEFALIADHTNTMIEGLREKRKIKNIFGKVVSHPVAKHLLSMDEDELKLGGKRRELVILMSDIRNFTTLTESTDPELLVSGLNTYFTDMIEIVRGNQGFVDKFIGDGILAVFGLSDEENAIANAVNAGIGMLNRVNEQRKNYSYPIEIGIGIHCGEVIAGNIGSMERLEYTVIGDAVNAAARLEGLTKSLQSPLLISAQVLEGLPVHLAELPWTHFGDQALKGKTEKIDVYGLDQV